ncbi:hypothetical protein ABZ729_34285 [Streptomyces sp. NPDC006678]|uniref:hypothetical protein n=1 Tax=Streptomyces sp. NPDC006678 TaxID=3157185 RepID=UPI0033DA9E2C
MDISDEGQKLDPEWNAVGNNVCGTLYGCRDASWVAERFVSAGWRSHASSWHGYEVETSWCQAEIDPLDGAMVLLNGVVDPQRLDELAGLLDRFGRRFSLELYDADDVLIREIHT